MKLRITSITATEVGQLIGDVTTMLEDRLRPYIEPCEYGPGIDQVAVFFVSVDTDPVENERYCVANNRSSRYKDLFTGKMVTFVGLAVPVDPALVARTPVEALPQTLEDLFLDELAMPGYAMPTKFDRVRFERDVCRALTRGMQQS